MYSRSFKAILKTGDGQPLETGRGRINFDEKYVEFRNEFVPLLKFGDPAKIVRVIGKEETHCFDGTVYLSSRKLLRIVNVRDTILADAELALSSNTSIKAHVTPVVDTPLFRSPLRKLVRFEINIHAISLTDIRFTSDEQFAPGEQLLLSCETPVQLKKVLIEVTRIISFGDKVSSHQCKVLELPEPSKQNLTAYMGRQNQYFGDGAAEPGDGFSQE